MAQEKHGNDGLQGLFLLVGITLGAVPLVKVVLFGGEVGRLLAWVPGTGGHPGDWLIPVGVVLVCLALIAVLERDKQKTT